MCCIGCWIRGSPGKPSHRAFSVERGAVASHNAGESTLGRSATLRSGGREHGPWRAAMNGFDRGVLVALNHFAHRAPWVDESTVWVNRGPLKGMVVVTALWWMWFSQRPDQRRVRATLIAAALGSFVALMT